MFVDLKSLSKLFIIILFFLNIDHPYFEDLVNQIYSTELQLNKANTSDIEAPCLDLHNS